jgi:heat shock protein HslJ
MKPVYYSLAILFLIFTTSCDETQRVINTAGNVQLNGNYTINEVKGKSYTPKGLVMTFDALNKGISVTTECNNMFGTYTLDLYVINFSEMASTKMYCEGKMDAEKEIGEALSETGSYTLDAGVLKLFSKNDRSLLLTATKVRDTNEN